MTRPAMATVEKWSRLATAVFAWLGMVGLGGYIFWTMHNDNLGRFLFQPPAESVAIYVAKGELPVIHWIIWYYSPLNIRYWGVAFLVFSPALGCSLIARYLAWRRER